MNVIDGENVGSPYIWGYEAYVNVYIGDERYKIPMNTIKEMMKYFNFDAVKKKTFCHLENPQLKPDVINELANKILIANFFEKEHIEEMLGKKITEQEYSDIVSKWNDNGCWDEITEMVRNWIEHNIKEKELPVKLPNDKICPKCGKRNWYFLHNCHNCGAKLEENRSIDDIEEETLKDLWQKYGEEKGEIVFWIR